LPVKTDTVLRTCCRTEVSPLLVIARLAGCVAITFCVKNSSCRHSGFRRNPDFPSSLDTVLRHSGMTDGAKDNCDTACKPEYDRKNEFDNRPLPNDVPKIMTKQRLKINSILYLVILFPNLAFAAPNIMNVSGIFIDGQSIVIEGNSFGEKSPATPVMWDNFETGTIAPGWDKVTMPGWVVYNGEGQARGSTYALRADRGGVNSVDLMKDRAFHDTLYISLKRRWDFEVIDRNQKFLRIYGAAQQYSIAWNYLSESPIHRPEYFCKDGVSPYVIDGTSIYSGVISTEAYPSIGKWLYEEFFIKMPSAINACDGEMGYRVSNNLHEYWPKNRCLAESVLPGPYQRIYLDNFGGPLAADCAGDPYASYDEYDCLPPGSYIWVDDIYIDDTWARVVIGNKPVYADCTQIEIQIPTTWDNDKGEIAITINQGSFDTLDGRYIYVIDANNVPNAVGYPIVLEAAQNQDIVAPAAPTSVSIK